MLRSGDEEGWCVDCREQGFEVEPVQGGRDDGVGHARPVRTGEAVGEMSLIDGHRTSASVVAETPVEAIELYRTAFQQLLDDAPALSKKLLLIQTARLRALDRRASALS